jgi:hypothetical protein
MPSMMAHGSPGWPNVIATGGELALVPPTSKFERMPGACASRLVIPFRLVGVSSSASLVNCVLVAVDVTSTTGAAPDTVIVSVTLPRLMVTSIRAANPAVSRMASRFTD